jgi:hypothetical protein
MTTVPVRMLYSRFSILSASALSVGYTYKSALPKREARGESVVSPPGRPAFSSASRRRPAAGGGEVPVLLRRVDISFLSSGGVKSVVVSPECWNNCSPLCPRSGDAGELVGEGVELWCSGRGRRGEGGDLRLELLSPVPSFVNTGWALASLLRIWGWCDAAPAFVVGCCYCLYRSLSFAGIDLGPACLGAGLRLLVGVVAFLSGFGSSRRRCAGRGSGMCSPPMVDQSWQIPAFVPDGSCGTQRSLAAIEPRLASGVRRPRGVLPWRRRVMRTVGVRTCRVFFVFFLFFRGLFALSLGQLGFGLVPVCGCVFVLCFPLF